MTKVEKDELVSAIDSFNDSGDYYDFGFLNGLVFGLNLRRGENKAVHILNGMALYEGGNEVYRYGGGNNEEVMP